MSPKNSERCVLLFDRDPQSIEILEKVFSDFGLKVVPVSDGDKGIRSLRSSSTEIVFADVQFPGLSGFVLLQKVINDNLNIPVVIVSKHKEDAIMAFRIGAADFFKKPINRGEIKSQIPSLLEKKQKLVKQPELLDSKELINKLEHENKELNALLKVSSSIDVSGDSKKILQQLTDLAAESMNCEAASIMLKNDRMNILEFVVATGDRGGHLETMDVPMGEGIAGWVAMHGNLRL